MEAVRMNANAMFGRELASARVADLRASAGPARKRSGAPRPPRRRPSLAQRLVAAAFSLTLRRDERPARAVTR
jgi:hypothetical protein